MKYCFQPATKTEKPFGDWFEMNNLDISISHSWMFVKDLRAWFRKWVFK